MGALNEDFAVFAESLEDVKALVAGVADKVISGHISILTESGDG